MNPVYLVIFGAIGFLVSLYIFYSKKKNTPLYCLIGKDCDAVVRSEYGKTFGVENTIPGMAYYLIIIIYGIGTILDRNVFKGNLVYYSIVGAGIGSVLFSIYLTAVQAFVLRKWCFYCIISSIASVLILVVVI